MCNLSQSVEEKARQEERLLLLKNFMENMKIPLEEAMAVLEVPQEDRRTCRKLLAD